MTTDACKKDIDKILKGIANDNDAMHEAKADALCSMGVGCGLYGICYAEKHGKPEACLKKQGGKLNG